MSEKEDPDRERIKSLVREAITERLPTAEASSPEAASPDLRDESVKDVITEADIRDLRPGARLLIREDAIVTPAARDAINALGIEVEHRLRRASTGRHRVIAIGADHGGYEMKERLKGLLDELGYRHRDFGTDSTAAVDYPDFAHQVARSVADGASDLGIIIDGAGIGSCIVANKVPGVRAAMCYDEASARNSREHNYANVLTLGGKLISEEKMSRIVSVWLSTPEGESRHGRRVAKITAIEKQYLLP
jgi:ribose 5-phosphate isomerase B